MEELLRAFTAKKPEIVFEWNDPETEAEGWVVVNSLRGRAAGGGTRMRPGLDRQEVEWLAKIMEVKFTVSGPPIGGAKSGIDFDPNDPRKEEVLNRWFRAVTPLLKHYYGTGGDLHVDEVKEVIPITEDYGLWHPQEGIVNGHFAPRENEKIHLIGQLRQGVAKKLEDPHFSPDPAMKLTVADMITGFGVAESVKHYYHIYRHQDLEGKKVLLQGWGNVAGAAGYYLAQSGARIIGIMDRMGGLLEPEGLPFDAVRELLLKNNRLTKRDLLPFEEINRKMWTTGADIFIPAAASRLISQKHVEALMQHGVQVICCGANAPFVEEESLYGSTTAFADRSMSLIPDFIANCGMARVFAALMEREVVITDELIFADVSGCIRKALEKAYRENPKTKGIAKTALGLALKELTATQEAAAKKHKPEDHNELVGG